MASSKEKDLYSVFLRKRSSNVWDHFHRSDDGQTAKCQICLKKLKTTDGSTTGLHTHLRSMHPDVNSTVIAKLDQTDSSPVAQSTTVVNITSITSTSVQGHTTKAKSKKQKLNDDFRYSESMEAVISRMTALDGASFRFLSESKDIRQLFNKSGYSDLPKMPNALAKMVFEHAEEIKREIIRIITAMKKNGERFSLTLEEWTSTRNKRYINVNLHCKAFEGIRFWNLGLFKIKGSMTATEAVSKLRDHLARFGIILQEDIISHTADGAGVTEKMACYIPGYNQRCLARGVQLAVIDTLYNTEAYAEETEALSKVEASQIRNEIDLMNSSSESDEDSNYYSSVDFQVENPIAHIRQADPGPYRDVIEKVRRLIRLIKKSPLITDALRTYVTKQFGENVQLQLDCRTKWSTMSDMIGTFLKMKDIIFKLLVDFNSDVVFTSTEIDTLADLHRNLEVVKLTILSLCQSDATLYTADTALKFMLRKLDQQNTSLSSSLAANLRNRIKERRQLIAGILHYLHDSESFYSALKDDTFPKPTGEEICDAIGSMLKRLKYNEQPISFNTLAGTEPQTELKREFSLCSSEVDINVPIATTSKELTLEEEFEMEMQKCKETKRDLTMSLADNFDLLAVVMAEKAIYDNTGERGVYLTQAYTYLTSIVPTSLESEQVFSSAGYFCSRIRSSLSDKMLDALIFLRMYYQEKG